MNEHSITAVLGRLLGRRETRPMVCIAGTVAFGVLLFGLGLAVAWVYGTMFRHPTQATISRVGDVSFEDITLGIIAAGILWLALLPLIWARVVRRRNRSSSPRLRNAILIAVGATLLLGCAAVAVCLALDVHYQLFDEREIAMTAVSLIAGGAALLLWLPVIHLSMYGLADTSDATAAQRVVCPKCDHSMVGLKQPVCPECGARFTLDELFAAQATTE